MFDSPLRPYQEEIVDAIVNNPRIQIWADMGLGKTMATLTAIDALFALGKIEKKVLILAPMRVTRTTWPEEIEKWNHFAFIKPALVSGSPIRRWKAFHQEEANVHLVNYDILPWLQALIETPDNWPYDMVVCDESTRFKSFRFSRGVKCARVLAPVAHTHIKRWVNLTGTPAPNGLMDLWGQTWFIDKGARLGRTFTAFKNRWFTQRPCGFGYDALPHAEKEIQEKLRDISISIRTRDYFNLEEPLFNIIKVKLSAAAKRAYREMERELFMELESGAEVEAANHAVKTMKCLQLANGAVYTDEERKNWEELHYNKLSALESIVNEAGGRPILVAYNFQSDLERILKRFPQARKLDSRPETIAEWNRGEIPMLVAHPKSCGHGLNLQDGGNILVFFGLDWNLESHMQIIERIGPVRQKQAGHERPVYVHYIVAEDTMDETVLERLRTKRDTQELIIEAMNAYKKRQQNERKR